MAGEAARPKGNAIKSTIFLIFPRPPLKLMLVFRTIPFTARRYQSATRRKSSELLIFRPRRRFCGPNVRLAERDARVP